MFFFSLFLIQNFTQQLKNETPKISNKTQIKQKYYKETIDAGPESKVISKYALDKAVKVN